MALATYANLQTSIADWLYRGGDTIITTVAPDLIALFEARFIRKMLSGGAVLQMEERDTASLTSQFLAKPTGWLAQRSLTLTAPDPTSVVLPTTPDHINRDYRFTGITGRPKFYAIVDTEYMFGPAPETTYTVESLYYKFPVLSNSNTANWLLTSYPDLYLYGALLEAEGYQRTEIATYLPMWKARVDEAMADLVAADHLARYPSLTIRVAGATP